MESGKRSYVENTNSTQQPSPKKQALGPSTSFADVLKDMNDQGDRGIDYHNGRLSEVTTNNGDLVFQAIDISYKNSTSVISLSGCTKAGNPVIAHILKFQSYFYIKAPQDLVQEDLEPLLAQLNFLRGGQFQFRSLFGSEGIETFSPAGSCLEWFMFELNISCLASWVRISGKEYEIQPEKGSDPRKSMHISVSVDKLKVINPSPVQFAPLRILSADIETATRDGKGPDPMYDIVHQISCMISVLGDSEPFYRVIFALDSCDPIEGTEVRSFRNEKQMLLAWRAFFRKVNPDVIIGHNSARFDWPYLLKRAQRLHIPAFELARVDADPVIPPTDHWFNWDWNACPLSHGRVNLDTFHCFHYNFQRKNNSLNIVADEYLGIKKEDVPFSELATLQYGDSQSRRRMAVYCAKDTWLALRLSIKLGFLETLANLLGKELVPLSGLFARFADPGSAKGFVNRRRIDFLARRLRRDA